MNAEPNNETWQVEAGGKIYDTSFDEMTTWIAEGSLLKIDRVRKGNLRWIEAGKVPALIEFFNAKDAAGPTPPVITSTTTEVLGVAQPTGEFTNAQPAHAYAPVNTEPVCAVHTDALAAYLCDTCANAFCKACPSAYGSTVRICPFCGAMCSPLAKVEKIRTETQIRHRAATQGFGFGDFVNALAHPFKFKASLIFGAIMFAVISLGQAAVNFGGMFMMASAILCFMLANTLTFGVLGNVADNFSQGKLDENFMPAFDDFSIWDDVVHPFFLSIGVYISSFGPLIAVAIVAVFMVMGAVKDEMNGLKTDAARTVSPGAVYAERTARNNAAMQDIIKKDANQQQRRVAAIENGDVPDDNLLTRDAPLTADEVRRSEEQDFEAINNLINEQRKAQLESAIGKTPETKAKEQAEMVKAVLGYGIMFVLLGGIALLWGLFYFPAACAVAGYTRSFTATVNPLVGLDTIRRLGVDYIKILLMALAISIMSAIVGAVLNAVFSPFDMPAVGNLPAMAIGNLFTFYFYVVFACVIGYALFKAADRLDLYSS